MGNHLLRDAVRAALGVSMAASVGFAPTVFAQQQSAEEAPAELGRIVTTGSRISRLDVETARPITVISREDIDRSGQPTVADVLRNATYNTFGEYRETSGNNFAGQALIGLKGLGSTRTLVLLNGRRLPRSPVTSDQGIDLNTIPLDAVDHIEILTDSASAVYGSDAIGGVINVVLRQDFSGVQLMGSMGRPTQEGADRSEGSVVVGGVGARSHFIVGAEKYHKDIIFSRDRSFTAPDPGDGVNFGTTQGLSPFGNTIVALDTFQAYADPNCNNVTDPSTGAPLFAGIYNDGPVDQYCTYAYANVAAETQSIDRNSLFINAAYEITPDVQIEYTGTYSQLEAFGRYAAVAGLFEVDMDLFQNLTPPLDSLQGINADGNYDAFILHRFVGLGPRDDHNTNTLLDNQVNLTGTTGRFDWDLGFGATRYLGKEIGLNYVKRSTIEQQVADGTYNPFDPLSPANEAAYGEMRHTNTRDIDTNFYRIQGQVSFDAGELPAGALGWAVGFEYNDERFQDIYDADRAANDVLGSAGNSASGARSNYAVFAEALIPITEKLEADAAFRYDDYNKFGNETSPTLAFRYRATDNVLIRASWGEGFRAPNLFNLFQDRGFSAESGVDITLCRDQGIPDDQCGQDQFDTWSGGNVDLTPETSESWNLGAAFQIGANANVAVDYWNIDIKDGIVIETAQGLINLEADGIALPAGAEINRAPPAAGNTIGQITKCIGGATMNCGIQYGWANLAKIQQRGVDIRFDYRVPLASSELNFRVIHSSVLKAIQQTTPLEAATDFAGQQDQPDYRTVFVADWARGNHGLTWTTQYISSYTNSGGNKVGPMAINDIQYRYDVTSNGQLTVGVLNAGNEDPPLDPYNDSGKTYFADLFNLDGRVPYLQYRQRF